MNFRQELYYEILFIKYFFELIESIVLLGEGGEGVDYIQLDVFYYRYNENIVFVVKKKLVVDIIDNIVINVKKFVVDIFQKFENGYICLYWKYD